MATVVLVGTLDTKSVEYAYVKSCIEAAGCEAVVVDTGILGLPGFTPDISAEEVARFGGLELQQLRFGKEGSDTRAVAIDGMAKGLGECLLDLVAKGRCDAVFGMGGSGGTNMISAAMRALPLGLPKLLLSTMMSGDVHPYVRGADIAMMYSVTDIAGLNSFSRLILANAAHAVAGMALYRQAALSYTEGAKKPLVGLTMFGVTTPGVMQIRNVLEAKGFDTIVFHATGSGGIAMEDMIRHGFIDGVIDFTTSELCDYAFGGCFSAGPDRLTAAGELGIPQVVVPGSLEVLNFPGVAHLPKEYDVPERKVIVHNATVCAVKASDDELRELGRVFGEKVIRAKGPAKILLPLDGLDSYSAKGGPWEDRDAWRVLFDAVHEAVGDAVETVEIDANINDPAFAQATADTFLELWKQSKSN